MLDAHTVSGCRGLDYRVIGILILKVAPGNGAGARVRIRPLGGSGTPHSLWLGLPDAYPGSIPRAGDDRGNCPVGGFAAASPMREEKYEILAR